MPVVNGVLELLDRDLILSGLKPHTRRKLSALVIEASLDSTNAALQKLPLAQQHATAVLAEHQVAGRGRRGRSWYSPFGRNLYLSLGWRFDQPLATLGCLPLVVALTTARALSRAGLTGHRIKWPNDLLLQGCKFGGCLVEVRGQAQGPCQVVAGVGINVQMPATVDVSVIGQPWTDLHSHLPGCSRNQLAALLLEEMLAGFQRFASAGFAPFRAQWQALDALPGQVVEVAAAKATLQGTVVGIDDQGALLLDIGAQTVALNAGEVSVRMLPDP